MYVRLIRSFVCWYRDIKSMGSKSAYMAAWSMTIANMLNIGALILVLALLTSLNLVERRTLISG